MPSPPDLTNLPQSRYSLKDFSHKGSDHFGALWEDVCVLLAHRTVGQRSNSAVSADLSCSTGSQGNRQAFFGALNLHRTSSDSSPQLWGCTLTPLQLGSSRPQPHSDVFVLFSEALPPISFRLSPTLRPPLLFPPLSLPTNIYQTFHPAR